MLTDSILARFCAYFMIYVAFHCVMHVNSMPLSCMHTVIHCLYTLYGHLHCVVWPPFFLAMEVLASDVCDSSGPQLLPGSRYQTAATLHTAYH